MDQSKATFIWKIKFKIEKILDGDKLIKGSKQVAGTFNRYFIRKVKKIRESLDSPSEDPMISYKKYVKTPKKKLVFSTINMSQLRQVFKNMKKSNSTTIDSISMRTLDRIKTAVLPLILRLINQINITKTFPDCLKIARIQPIRKSFDLSALSCESYRPVNILCPVSKLVEKFWVKDILNHLKLNQMVDQNHQGGFPKRSSTTTNLTIYQKIAQFKLRKKKNSYSSIGPEWGIRCCVTQNLTIKARTYWSGYQCCSDPYVISEKQETICQIKWEQFRHTSYRRCKCGARISD